MMTPDNPGAEKGSAADDKLLTPEQLAERLGLEWPAQKGWIYDRARRWIESEGKRGIPTVRLGRYRRFSPSQIDRWIERVEHGEAEA